MTDDTIHQAEAAATQAEAAAVQGVRFLEERVERATAAWSLREKVLAATAGVALLACAISLAAWALRAKPVPEVVQPRAEVHQADGSDVAATAPPDSPEARALPPPRAQLPRGAKVERRDRIVAQAVATAASSCPPVTVDLQQIRTTDGGRRVIASSPDGSVLSAVDVPVDPAPLPPPDRPWAAGLSYGTDRAVGVWVERDLGRLRAGLEVERSAAATTARVRVGVRW